MANQRSLSPHELLEAQDPPHPIIDDNAEGLEDIELPAWVTFLIYQVQSNGITFEDPMAFISAKANKQTFSIVPAIIAQSHNSSGSGILCKNLACGKRHPYQPQHPYHNFCKQHHAGGMDACFLAHPELKTAFKKRLQGKNNANNTKNNRQLPNVW